MVRLIRTIVGGRQVWAEVAPTACTHGHTQLRPGRGPCPTCGEMLRVWACAAVEAGVRCGDVLVDDEHVHPGGETVSGAEKP